MITVATARRLKEGGLAWEPAQGDRFAVPDRGMDDRVFIINDMATIIEMIQGAEMVTFHGTPEWALDYVYLGEAVWLPEEGQLRERLHALLMNERPPVYDLVFMDGAFTCRFEWRGEPLAFSAEDASDAYAAALLHVMKTPE